MAEYVSSSVAPVASYTSAAVRQYTTAPSSTVTATTGTVYRSPARETYVTPSTTTGTVYRSPARQSYVTTSAPVSTTTGVVRTSGYTTSAYPTEYRSSSYTTAPVERVIRSDISPARYSTTTLANAEYSTSAYPTRTYTTSVPHETVVHRSPVRTEYVGQRVVSSAPVVHHNVHRVIEGRAATHDETHDSHNWATHHRDGRLSVGEVARLLNVPVEELTHSGHYPRYRGLRAEDPVPNTYGFYTRDLRAVPAPAPVVVERKIAPPPPKPKVRDYAGLNPFVGFGLTESDATKGKSSLPVETIWENGPAWDAGMRIGDRVTRIGESDEPINSLQQVQRKLASEAKIGKPLRVDAVRGSKGEPMNFTLVPKTTGARAANEGWNDIFFDTKAHKKLGESTGQVKV